MKRLTISMLLLLCGLVSACAKSDIRGETVEYTAGNAVMKGYLAYDNNIKGKRPGILVVHEWWGQNEYVRERARMLAKLGYTALAVDMYGNGKQTKNSEEAGQFAREISQNIDLERSRFMAAMNFLQQQKTVDPGRIAAVGYSFGGSVVLQMARSGANLKGVVSFYGSLTPTEPAQPGAIKAKILVCLGEKDWYITPQQITLFRNEMQKAKADYRMITYAGAEHDFADPNADSYAKEFKLHFGYNAEADKKSWSDMRDFLKGIL